MKYYVVIQLCRNVLYVPDSNYYQITKFYKNYKHTFNWNFICLLIRALKLLYYLIIFLKFIPYNFPNRWICPISGARYNGHHNLQKNIPLRISFLALFKRLFIRDPCCLLGCIAYADQSCCGEGHTWGVALMTGDASFPT